jgi:YbbR domain-containing protein
MEGERQVKGILNKDITLKIISGLIAVILWLYVVDIQNPETETTLKDIPVNIIGTEAIAESGLFILSDSNQTVSLKVKGRRKTLAGLSEQSFKAVADLRGLSRTGEHSVPIQVEPSIEGVTILEKKPYYATVKLDKMMEIQKTINVITKGEVKEPYVALDPQITPNVVTLRGPSSIISTIGSLRVSVDISGQNKDIVTKQKYEIYNKNEEKINSSYITKDVETVQIVYPILKSKQVPVVPQLAGSVAENYVIAKTEVFPSTVKIAGKSEVIDSISQIFTEPVTINRIEKDVEVDVPIHVTEGLKLVEPVNTVKIKIDVERQILRTLTVQNIRVDNVPENLSYKLITKQLEVTLKGIESNINILRSSDIYAAIDIKNLGEGQHEVPVDIKVFSDVQVVGSHVVTVKLSRQVGEDIKPVGNNNQNTNSNTNSGYSNSPGG